MHNKPEVSISSDPAAIERSGTASASATVYILKPGAITITSPTAGRKINRPDTLVRGTIDGAALTGTDIGVTVNGVVAHVYGNQFAANHVPLSSGDNNTITAIAISSDDYMAKDSVTVRADTTGNNITLSSNQESGLSPLDFTLKLAKTYTSPGYSFSCVPDTWVNNGDNATIMEFKRHVTDPGLYYIMVEDTEVVDNVTSVQHFDTIAIMAETRTQLDTKLKAKWGGIRSTLTGNDVNAAVKYFDGSTKTIYRNIFAGMPDQLAQMAQDMADIQLIQAENDRAEYDLRIVRNGTVYSYFVLFVKDENGLWKLKSF